MKYRHSQREHTAIFSLLGDMRFEDYKTFAPILKALDHKDNHAAILNLVELESIDSAGMGMILLAKEAAEKQGKLMEIHAGGGIVATMLTLARIPFRSPGEALPRSLLPVGDAALA